MAKKLTYERYYWFHGQIKNDGSLYLKFPVADFREIRREILKYGASVEVISPKELRKEIKKEKGVSNLSIPFTSVAPAIPNKEGIGDAGHRG